MAEEIAVTSVVTNPSADRGVPGSASVGNEALSPRVWRREMITTSF